MKNNILFYLSLILGILLIVIFGVRQSPDYYNNSGSFEVTSAGKGYPKAIKSPGLTLETPGNDSYTMSFTPDLNKENEIPVASASPALYSPAFTLNSGNASVYGEAGCMSEHKTITIEGLNVETTPPLDQGMVNVTGENAAFRMLPHGTFEKDITIVLPYDTALIPPGYSEREIYTYYYNESLKTWLMLKRDSIDTENKLVVSKVNHFTDFINAIIKTPEMPETQAYTPTSIKDLKAANPMEGMQLFQPPTANNNGTANMNYPIEVPAGRQGMQPNLAVTYGSGGNNGWLGIGWDVSIPSITVDNRWGVPRYNSSKESEVYMYQGEQLVTKNSEGKHNPMPHRTNVWQNRSYGEKQFYTRVEEAFDSIVRHGTSTTNYWWSVTDRRGVTHYYGKQKGADAMDANSVLRDAAGNIAHWALTESVDPYGNNVRYYYTIITDYNNNDNQGSTGKQIYLSHIRYTGHGNEDGKYTVLFTQQDAKRQDVIVNARSGFKEVSARLLCNIKVRYEDSDLTAYYFFTENNHNSNYKTRLTDMVRVDEPEFIPNIRCNNDIRSLPWEKCRMLRYNFEYYNYPSADKLFGTAKVSNLESDNIKATFLTGSFNDDKGKATALGGTKGKSWSVGGTLSIGIGVNVCMTTLSLGGNFDYSRSQSEGLLTLIDLDGDGLADKVFKKDGVIYYRKQYANTDGTISFGPKYELAGLSDFLKESSSTTTWGLQASAGLSLSGSWPKTTSTTGTYFSDVNADGLPDLITEKGVMFNTLVNGRPTFTLFNTFVTPPSGNTDPTASPAYVTTSAMTPCGGIIFDGEVSDSIACETVREYDRVCKPAEYEELIAKGYELELDSSGSFYHVYKTSIRCEPVSPDPDIDAVKVWVAPYNGTITIQSGIRLIEDTSESRQQAKFVNGVLYSVQLNQNNVAIGNVLHPGQVSLLFNGHIPADNYALFSNSSTVNVKKNDVLFFRLQSGGNRSFDKVKWDQLITYSNLSGVDDYGKDIRRYKSDEDFVFTGKSYFQAPKNGTVKITGTIRTQTLNHWAKLYITVNDNPVSGYPIILTSNMNMPLNLNFSVSQNDNIKFIIHGIPANGIGFSNTTWSNISFNPKVLFTGSFNSGNLDTIAYYPPPIMLILDSQTNKIDSLYRILFGTLYRGWGQFGYNNNYSGSSVSGPISMPRLIISSLLAANNPDEIDTTQIYLDESVGNDMSEEGLTAAFSEVYNPLSSESSWIEMIPDGKLLAYVGFGNINYITKEEMSNTRPKGFIPAEENEIAEEIPDYDHPVPSNTTGYAVQTVRKQSESKLKNGSFNASAPIVPISVGMSTSRGESTILTDYMDLNGDRYPDIIGKASVQYTNPWGGIGAWTPMSNDAKGVSASSTNSSGETFGASYSIPKRGSSNNPKNAKISFDGAGNVGASHGGGSDESDYIFMDINGDGLPDKVTKNSVALNIGYGFLPPEPWNHAFIRKGSSENSGMSFGGNFNIAQASIGGGIGVNRSSNNTNQTLLDMNGDGLPDKVTKSGSNITVQYNLGNGKWSASSDQISFPNSTSDLANKISFGESYSESINASATGGFTFFGIIKFNIGVQTAPYNRTFSKELVQIVDMNNDGYPDYVVSDNEAGISIRYNQAGKTNLLKRVTNFTGSYIELDYNMPLSNYEQPQRSWNLASVRTEDPFTPAGGARTFSEFEYAQPHYDRFERIAYGYATVISRQYDTENNDELYRYTVEEYNNYTFVKRGKKTRDCLYDRYDKPYVETLYEAQLVDMNSGELVGDADCPAEVFPMFEADVTHYYEGGDHPLISTAKTRVYDRKRNIVEYINRGDLAVEGDDFRAIMTYYTGKPYNLISLVKEIRVEAGEQLLRRREAVYGNKGDLQRIKQYNHDYAAELGFKHDSYGNMVHMVFPENAAGERNSHEYQYDDQVHSYPIEIRNALGYRSTAKYDYRWGKPVYTVDMNENEMKYQYDNLGRLLSVTAPYEIDAGVLSTIAIRYFPANYNRFDIFSPGEHPFSSALTSHYDPEHPGDMIHTVLYCDGLGRMLQTQKKSEIDGQEVMIVSGKVIYDPFGRTIEQYHPIAIPISAPNPNTGRVGNFHDDYDPVTITKTYYDVLDRKTTIILPDESATHMKYGVEEDAFGVKRFWTITTDALGNSVQTYLNHMQLQTTIIAPMNTVTTFVYNPLGELMGSTDPDGHTTKYEYDLFGKRVFRSHPDAGTTRWHYDPSGNLVRMITANLESIGQEIVYKYHYNQLIDINYPLYPENYVRYVYGDPGAPDNGTGRIISMEDATSFQTFKYGKLGEVVENNRIFVLPGDENVYSFTMNWEYDSWNRVKKIIYPDGERVNYRYNRGGMLQNMTGEKYGEHFVYIKDIQYNKFDAKTRIHYGNGTAAAYEYDILQRLSSLVSTASSGELMQRIKYTFDNVSNITHVENMGEQPNGLGGRYRYNYHYDELYRLINSDGEWENGYNYGVKMKYTPDGRILNKDQAVNGNSMQSYSSNDYYYANEQPHAVRKLSDGQIFSWDLNGNMTEHWHTKNFKVRRLCWSEENRLQGVTDDKSSSFYFYDAGGDRTVKLTGYNEWIDINGTHQVFGVLNNPTLYTSEYVVASRKGYTKHYYIEGQRIVSKIGQGGLETIREHHGVEQETCLKKAKKLSELQYRIKECLNIYDTDFKFIDYEDHYGWLVNLYQYRHILNPEKELYFYHPDHLGSSSWITNTEGMPIQHLSYLPFGEEFVDQQTSNWSAAYKFTGKEKDEETSYNYFGARYYNSDLSIWLSVDPLSDKLPAWSPYNYTLCNPIKLVDPDGKFPKGMHKDMVSAAFKNTKVSQGALSRIEVGTSNRADIIKADVSAVHMDGMKGYSSLASAYNAAKSNFSAEMKQGHYEDAGVALHTVADFYSHSNYIPLYQQYAKDNNLSMDINDIPTFSDAMNDPKLSEYLKNNDFKTGTFSLFNPYSSDKGSHNKMNLDNNKSETGGKTYNGKNTMHEAAKAVAQKELNKMAKGY